MNFLQKLEKKIGKYAIRNLTRYIIIAYVIGYFITMISVMTNVNLALWISLNPRLILQGQIWRLVSWVLIPPSNISILTVIMLFNHVWFVLNVET